MTEKPSSPHDHGPTIDVFIGGPCDGRSQPFQDQIDPIAIDPETGARYRRQPDLDTPGRRVFLHMEEPHQLITLSVDRLNGHKGVTLQQLYDFANRAIADGHDPDAVPRIVSTWGGHLRRVSIEPPENTGKQ